jgi:multicomponent Na+:H+ antiporter subunit D
MELWTSTHGGALLAAAVLLPFVGMLLGLVLGGRQVQRVAFALMPLGLALAVAIAVAWSDTDGPLVYLLGAWSPPLGIALRADGPAVAMLLAVAVVVCGIGLFAHADFGTPPGVKESRASFAYWLLLLAVWGALNLVFVSGDLFTLYVALELLTFAGVPLVCLAGSGETLRAALRYMLFALCGSVLYLLGAVLLYGGYGTLDIPLLAGVVQPEPIAWTSLALMTVGLLAKTALFPLHIWLPPAHGGAPAAASAVLSALVIKGSWFLVLRLWLDVMPGVASASAAQLLAGMGAAAIVVGSVVALRQQRLKLLVAYSTVAQIGYLFLLFPLAFDAAGDMALRDAAQSAGVLQAIAHATAKAGMFMAAGLVYAHLGHDRIDDLSGAARALPVAMLAFFVGGIALMGVLPSGAYLAKKLLLASADESGQWWWTLVLQGGAAFTAAYVVLIAVRALRRPATPLRDLKPVSMLSQIAALSLALASLALSLAAVWGPLPAELISNPLSPKDLGNTLAMFALGALLASALSRRPLFAGARCDDAASGDQDSSLVRRATVALGVAFEQADAFLRRWSSASLSLLTLAALFGALLLVGAPK